LQRENPYWLPSKASVTRAAKKGTIALTDLDTTLKRLRRGKIR
jgi:hypothetical protein